MKDLGFLKMISERRSARASIDLFLERADGEISFKSGFSEDLYPGTPDPSGYDVELLETVAEIAADALEEFTEAIRTLRRIEGRIREAREAAAELPDVFY